MKMKIAHMIVEAANGRAQPLMKMLDHLLYDREYPMRRILEFADRRFGIPPHITLATIVTYI